MEARQLLSLGQREPGRHRPRLPAAFGAGDLGHACDGTVRVVVTLAATVAAHARRTPDAPAFVTADASTSWREYHEWSDTIASALVDAGHVPGERIAVRLPDTAGVHAAFLGVEKAGCVIVGIGARAGQREVDHLLGKTGAAAVYEDESQLPRAGAAPDPGRALRERDVWLLNSTSGTTGLPKVVMHDQARWFAFHDLAVAAGALSSDDVFMSVLPAPFGFGIWTAHVTPTVLGAPCVVMPRFDADECLELIERERVTVLAAVSTQFVMLLEAASAAHRDLTSLRVLFTGGEMVPYQRAAEFEDRTGCSVLQFYGSNETGALSRTTLADDREHRLRTAGRVIPEMHVRLFDDDGGDVTASGGPGIAACKGAVNCLGYYEDPEANARLYTDDGWMLTGDYCTDRRRRLPHGRRPRVRLHRAGRQEHQRRPGRGRGVDARGGRARGRRGDARSRLRGARLRLRGAATGDRRVDARRRVRAS